MDIWKKIVPSTRNSECKGPEAESAWQYLRNAKKASVDCALPVLFVCFNICQ